MAVHNIVIGKGCTYGWREAEELRSNLVVLRLDSRDAHTDYKAAYDYSDTYDMAVSSDAAHSHTAYVGEKMNIKIIFEKKILFLRKESL